MTTSPDAQQRAIAILRMLNRQTNMLLAGTRATVLGEGEVARALETMLAADGIGNVMNGENDVLYGIRTTASLFSTGHLRVADTCTGLLGEIPSYAWDPKATDKGLDRPLKVADHSVDALRYAVATTETLWRPYTDAAP